MPEVQASHEKAKVPLRRVELAPVKNTRSGTVLGMGDPAGTGCSTHPGALRDHMFLHADATVALVSLLPGSLTLLWKPQEQAHLS